MRRPFRREPPRPPALSWAQQIQQYDGHAREQYRAGKDLLVEAQPEYERSRECAKRQQREAKVLRLLTTVLAAAAGITILPESVSRWISATIAFCAALISGIIASFAPERAARTAHLDAVDWAQFRDDVTRFLRHAQRSVDSDASREELEKELARLQARRTAILSRATADVSVGGSEAADGADQHA